MKFDSHKDIVFSVILLGLNAILIGIGIFVLINGEMEQHEYWALIPIIAMVGLFFWLYFGTNYELNESGFIYQCGPFIGKIKVDRITEIVKGKTHWIGLIYATAKNGLIVKYDTYGAVYISPKTNELFIQKILELNSEIKISDGQAELK